MSYVYIHTYIHGYYICNVQHFRCFTYRIICCVPFFGSTFHISHYMLSAFLRVSDWEFWNQGLGFRIWGFRLPPQQEARRKHVGGKIVGFFFWGHGCSGLVAGPPACGKVIERWPLKPEQVSSTQIQDSKPHALHPKLARAAQTLLGPRGVLQSAQGSWGLCGP